MNSSLLLSLYYENAMHSITILGDRIIAHYQ